MAARIIPSDVSKGRYEAAVVVQLEDDTNEERELLTYYDDELHFTEESFIGKTVGEAYSMRSRTDRAWMRSPSYTPMGPQ